jgi:hypothetical protein
VTLNYPVVSTLVKAIDKSYLKGFAGLTSSRTHQHIKVNNEMEKGHIDQSWQGKHSTKAFTTVGNLPAFPPNFEQFDTMEPLPQELFNARTHIVFITIIEITGMLFSNQSGNVPSCPTKATSMSSSSTFIMQILSNLSPLKARQRRSSCKCTRIFIVNCCCLTDQIDFILNMLRPCCQNPALSAFEALEGPTHLMQHQCPP